MSPNDELALARTVLRQGELRLQAQLQLALAADQRAMTLAAIFTTLATGVLGASFYLEAPVNAGGFACGVALATGALLALASAMPIRFAVIGNEPDNWWSDDVESRPLATCLRRESENYQGRIEKNSERLTRNAWLLNIGAALAVTAPLSGIAAVLVVLYLDFAG